MSAAATADASAPGQATPGRVGLAAISLAFVMITLDATIVNVALPAIRADVGGGLGALQWVVNGYTLAFAAFLLTVGATADRLGARRVFLVGLAVFAVGSLACAVAPSAGMLVVARVVQGLGAAALLPCSLALIVHGWPAGPARARALGVWGGMSGIGLAAGPVLGGIAVALVGWRAIFVVNLPVAALAAVLTRGAVAETPRRPRERLDPFGQTLAVAALAGLTGGLIEAGQRAWSDPLALALLGGGLLAAVAFVAVEARVAAPMLPLDLFGARAYAAATGLGLLFNFNLYGTLFCLALFLQQRRGDSAQAAGLTLLPLTVVVGLNAFSGGRWIARWGPRRPMLAGTSAGALGAATLAAGASHGSLAVLIGGSVVLGFCSLTMPAMTAVAMGATPVEQAGLASGVLNAARQTGGALGVALLGALLTLGPHGQLDLRVPMVAVAAAYLTGLILALTATRPHHGT